MPELAIQQRVSRPNSQEMTDIEKPQIGEKCTLDVQWRAIKKPQCSNAHKCCRNALPDFHCRPQTCVRCQRKPLKIIVIPKSV